MVKFPITQEEFNDLDLGEMEDLFYSDLIDDELEMLDKAFYNKKIDDNKFISIAHDIYLKCGVRVGKIV